MTTNTQLHSPALAGGCLHSPVVACGHLYLPVLRSSVLACTCLQLYRYLLTLACSHTCSYTPACSRLRLPVVTWSCDLTENSYEHDTAPHNNASLYSLMHLLPSPHLPISSLLPTSIDIPLLSPSHHTHILLICKKFNFFLLAFPVFSYYIFMCIAITNFSFHFSRFNFWLLIFSVLTCA
jgi:hypothetical protein